MLKSLLVASGSLTALAARALVFATDFSIHASVGRSALVMHYTVLTLDEVCKVWLC